MKNKMTSMLSGLLILALLPWPTMAQDAGDDYAPFLNPPARGVPAQAGEAIFGRVFGVQGAGADVKYHVWELGSRTPGNAAIRSALLPGWGQTFNQQRVKGALLFFTTVGTAVGAVTRYHRARNSYDDYKANGLKDASLFDDYEDQRTQATLLGAIAVLLYGYGVVDAHRNAYSSLYSRVSVELALSPSSARMEWQKRF